MKIYCHSCILLNTAKWVFMKEPMCLNWKFPRRLRRGGFTLGNVPKMGNSCPVFTTFLQIVMGLKNN
jgi:hypothetical protein